MGTNSSPTAQLIFEDVRVPADRLLGVEGGGFTVALAALDAGRLGIAACAVGLAQAALDAAVAYAGERRQFGRPIDEFQGVSFMLADMATAVAGCASPLPRGGPAQGRRPAVRARMAAMAKLAATDAAMKVTTDAIQVLGGAGYTQDFPVERYFREAKALQIVEGTNQVQRMVIGRALQRRARARDRAASWRATERVLLHGGTVYSPVSPFATAMLIDGDTIAWLGEDSAAARPPRQRRSGHRPARRARHPRLRRRPRARDQHRPDAHRPGPAAHDVARRGARTCSRRGHATCAGRRSSATAGTRPAGPRAARRAARRSTEPRGAASSTCPASTCTRRSCRAPSWRRCPELPRPARLRRDGPAEPAGAPRRPRGGARRRSARASGRGAPGHARSRGVPRHRGMHEMAGPTISSEDDLRRAARPRPRRARVRWSSATGASWPARAASTGPARSAPWASPATCSSTAPSGRAPPACASPTPMRRTGPVRGT